MKRMLMIAVLLVASGYWSAPAYDIETHRVLGSAAAGVSSLDTILRHGFGFPEGVATTLSHGKQADEVVGFGARDEDDPPQRVLNHFHNPLVADWDNAGLRVIFSLGQSSALWQQREDQHDHTLLTGGGNWSWQDARRFILDALTRQTERGAGSREEALEKALIGLGHLTHLIQDATVPAHVRNDAHLAHEVGRIHFGVGDGYERWVARRPAEDIEALAGTGTKPDGLKFTLTDRLGAPVPVARLIDTDFLNSAPDNLSRLAGADLGVAEYTHGNFFSDDTIFRTFALPRKAGLAPERVTIVDGDTHRHYRSKVTDGEKVKHFVREGVWTKPLTFRGSVFTGYVLDDTVYEEYARLLLPRAVGYSAALIDYFFRGSMSLGLTDDDGGLRVVGTNTSLERLGPGILQMFYDDAAGQRRPLSAQISIDPIEPGGDLPEVPITQPTDARQLIAVYRGALGDERPMPATTVSDDFPGAVIGQVVSALRVEEIITDDVDWFLRTPRGVFRLPLKRADVEVLQWGDHEDTLVGRSALGDGKPNLFYAYRLEREPGSREPRLKEEPDGGVLVDVTLLSAVTLPVDFPLGIAVEFSETLRYQQVFLEFADTVDLTVIPPIVTRGDGRAETLVDEARSVMRSYRLVLSLANLDFGAPHYQWFVSDLALTHDGRILAQITLDLHAIPWSATFSQATREVAVGADAGTGAHVLALPARTFDVESFPRTGTVTVLLDLTNREVLAATTPPVITISRHSTLVDGLQRTRRFVKVRSSIVNDVGEIVGQRFVHSPWLDLPTLNGCPGEAAPVQSLGHVVVNEQSSFEAQYLHSDLAPFQLGPLVEHRTSTGELISLCPSFGEDTAVGFSVTRTLSVETPTLVDPGMRRVRGLAGPSRFVLAMNRPAGGTGQRGRILTWTPGVPAGHAEPRLDYKGDGFIATTGTEAAILYVLDREHVDGLLVPLVGPVRSEGSLGPDVFDYIVLGSSSLYNVRDLKFHGRPPSLARTQLPATLAPVLDNPYGTNPFGDYHVIGLRDVTLSSAP